MSYKLQKSVFRLLTALIFFTCGSHIYAQDSSSRANVVFVDALRIYNESLEEDEAAQIEAAVEVLRLFDLIVTAYPESIPAKRIVADGQVGPINIDELRRMGGMPTAFEAALGSIESLIEDALTGDRLSGDGEPMPLHRPDDYAEGAVESGRELVEALEWYQRVVPSGSLEGGFSHGQFPSVGQRTHPGVDIIAACGQDVTAPWQGEVAAVVKAGDPAFATLGNVVILRHVSPWVRPVYSGYFNLASTPLVADGIVAQGEKLGVTGGVHGLEACGVHFEISAASAEEISNPLDLFNFAHWPNALGVGDWHEDADFESFWTEPEAWLTRLKWIEEEGYRAPQLLAQDEWVSIYLPGLLGQFNQTKRHYLRGSREQGLRLTSIVDLVRVPLGLQITLTHQAGIQNPDATEAVVLPEESLAFTLRASVYVDEADDQPIAITQVALSATFSDRKYNWNSEPNELLILTDDVLASNFIRLELVSDKGIVFSLGQDIELAAEPQVLNDSEALIEQAEALASKLKSCLRWNRSNGTTITFAAIEGVEGILGVGNVTLVASQNVPQSSVDLITAQFTRRSLAALCRSQAISPLRGSFEWPPIEIVFGKEAE